MLFKYTSIFLFVTLILTSLGVSKKFNGPTGTIVLEARKFGNIEFVPLIDLADSLNLSVKWMYESGKIELRNKNISIDLMTGSKFVQINKSDIHSLRASLVFIKGEPYIASSFLTDTLSPYIKKFKTKKGFFYRKKRIVVLDPGHGGHDTGAIGYKFLKEKELVLDIARRVRTILIKNGIKVRMTRDSDTFIPLARRADIANGIGASIFVSIHANAVSKNKRAISGCEVYYLSKAQSTSERKTEHIENMGIRNKISSRWNQLTFRIKKWLLSRHFKKNMVKSKKLAESIYLKLKYVTIGKSRGVKTANFSVLRNSYCPASLIEVGYITNPTDATYLRRSSYKQKIAEAIAQGIINYLNKNE